MFIGAQVSLYPMTSEFVTVITSGLDALTPYQGKLRIETDDMSTLMVGAPDPLIDAIRDLFAATARHARTCHDACHPVAGLSGRAGRSDLPVRDAGPRAGSVPGGAKGALRSRRSLPRRTWAFRSTSSSRSVRAGTGSAHGRDLRLHRVSKASGTFSEIQELLHATARRCRRGVRDRAAGVPAVRPRRRPCHD